MSREDEVAVFGCSKEKWPYRRGMSVIGCGEQEHWDGRFSSITSSFAAKVKKEGWLV